MGELSVILSDRQTGHLVADVLGSEPPLFNGNGDLTSRKRVI
jgi:hypothetical protein